MNRCQWLTFTCICLLLLGIECKKNFPETLGRSIPLMCGSGAMASALFAVSLFLAVRELLCGTSRTWRGVLDLALSVVAILYLFGSLFAGYVFFKKTYNQLDFSTANLVPKLQEKARSADSEAKRMLMAERAYEYCGVDISYRRDDGGEVEYTPTIADEVYWKQFKARQDRNAALKEQIIGGQIKQLPTVITLNSVSFLLALFAAIFWYRARKPDTIRNNL